MNDRRTALYGAASLLVLFGAASALANHGLAAALLSGAGAGLAWMTGRSSGEQP